MRIERYTPQMQTRWDDFVKSSTNGTFLHQRPFMDYHSDRFADHSLMAFDHSGRLVAVMPACQTGHELYSHQGLTYGGWLTARHHMPTPVSMQLWQATLAYMQVHNITALHYRPVPHIYHRHPSADDHYALWRLGATQEQVMVSHTIDLSQPWLITPQHRTRIRRATAQGYHVEQSTDIVTFHSMLTQRLTEAHGVAPTHTLQELQLLQQRFPGQIRLYMAYDPNGQPHAGTLIFDTGNVLHTQYIATTEHGRSIGLLPLLVKALIDTASPQHRYIDFGISTTQGGQQLNDTLATSKYNLGGRPTVTQQLRLQSF